MNNFCKSILPLFFAIVFFHSAFAREWAPASWPVMKHYDRDHLYRIALPLGGIGTGTVSLGGRGELRDWEIMNVPAKNFSTVTTGNNAPFFAIYVKPQGGKSQTRLLEGPLYSHEFLHYEGRPVNHHGFPRFADASFDAAYPFGQVNLSDIAEADDDPMASLSLKTSLAPGKTECFTFFITWNFPNRRAWSSVPVGNYYSTLYSGAWDVAEKTLPELPRLERETLAFVNALSQSSCPDVIKEAALFNLSTLRSQTIFRIPSGHLMGWEGVMDRFGSCQGSCTHVWNYETATPYLFGALARTMRDVEFNYATNDKGLMNFRAALPLSEAAKGSSAAADGQMGCLMKLYREWQLSGDNNFLSDNWEQAKKVLAFAWTEKGWDGNRDGVMEGSQHNTMDVNYFGPNPQMGFWYLGALRAMEEMALAMRDKDFVRQCRSLYENGSRWIDSNLFNGEYYEHRITDPKTFEFLDPDAPDSVIPSFQLGKGCLVDQLVGQYMSSLCGLGYLGNPDNIRTTLRSIMKYNFIDDFSSHFNNMRSYVMGNEAGLLMASWPKGRLKVPFPYFAEVMTGFEYCAATGMLYEGMDDEALTCISAIRDRFDGARRIPFSEPECGHHYARAMASWSTMLAWSRFSYSGVSAEMKFTDRPGTYFWSNGYAWGTCKVDAHAAPVLTVIKGTLPLKALYIGSKKYRHKAGSVAEGRTISFS